MRLVRQGLAICLAVLFIAPSASAQQQSVIGKSALDKAVQERVSRDEADREAIRSLLQRADVREIAGKAGLSVQKAEAAVATLEGDDLQRIATYAQQAHDELAGGASTVVISTTTIILVLLIVILIVLLAD